MRTAASLEATNPAGATAYASLCEALTRRPRRWLVTGAAGFIGSHLVERLLALGQEVRGVDDFSNGCRANLEEVRAAVGDARFEHFDFVKGDVRDPNVARRAVEGVELVSHQAALGSVPRSLEEPLAVLDVNLQGALVMYEAARAAGCERFVYASSSSVYGDDPGLPKREDRLGRPLSPYAVSKRALELVLGAAHGDEHGDGAACAPRAIGLRYFNVVGPRQRADTAWAAVVPLWIAALRAGEAPCVYGDGTSSRDFTPIGVVVQANLQAAAGQLPAGADSRVVNVALGRRTSLLALEQALRAALARGGRPSSAPPARHLAARPGDVAHSQADLARFQALFGLPAEDLSEALRRTTAWFASGRS